MALSCRHCGQTHETYLTVCPVTGGRLGTTAYTVVDEDELLVGSVVAERYHVRDILGQGSTGTVFGVEHMVFGRNAAMKVLRPRYTTLDSVQRIFQSDVRAALGLCHPSLCEVFDIGTLPDGAPFFVMERLEGDTLGSRLGRERFSTAAAVDLMMQLLAVMDTIHAREMLLRDLRPQNIFLSHRRGCRPVVKILDFGLARLTPLDKVKAEWDALRAVVGANDSSGLLSIPYYLSPERARGDQTLEPANDIFIAAAIGYESLTAQKAFSATSWAGLMQLIARGQPTPLGTLRPDTPEELQQLLMRALSAQPRTRPQSAREMQDELRAVFEGTRRGSTQVRAAAAPAPPSLSDSSVHTPRRILEADTPGSFETVPGVSATHARPSSASAVRVAHEHIPSTSTERPGEPPPTTGDDYEDETRTDQKLALTAAERLQAGMIDEASADHPIRTVRPPSPNASLDIEIDVEVEHDEPATSRGQDLATVLGLPLRPRGENEEEETETMQLTPEMRARIEQMSKTATTAAMPVSSVEDSSRPPPTRRLTKPPRR